MPNFQNETGIKDEPWERIRKAMCIINKDRLVIRRAERRIADATQEIAYVLWPRTDKRVPVHERLTTTGEMK